MASTIGAVEDLVVEDREVERKTETNGMCGRELGDSNIGSSLVSLKGLVGAVLPLVAGGELGEVTVVVTHHLVVEDLGLSRSRRGNEVLVKDVEDVLADLGQLALNLLPVALDHRDLDLIALRLLLLLDRGHNPPGSTASTNDVLVGDREEVTLLDGELLVRGSNTLHVLDHLLIALSLLSELGEVDGIFTRLRHCKGVIWMLGDTGRTTR